MTTHIDDKKPANALAGAVNWELAARTGARLAPRGPVTSRYTAEQVVSELTAAAVRAEGPVREVSLLADGLAVPAARVVDRGGWIGAAAHSMAQLSGKEPNSVQGPLLSGKTLAGLQAGGMLAFLSTAVLGQYDPFTGDDGTLLLVAPNIVHAERALKVRPSDFRLWVCLHEVTHRVQFSASPWLAGYLQEQVAILGEAGNEPISDSLARLTGALRERKPGDPGGVVGLLRATQAPAQRDAMDRLLMLGTLLEGHADHVMDAVGPAVVPTVDTIRKAFDQRRQTPGNPVRRLVRALLGVDAKIAQYVRGKAFVDAVVAQVGMQQFNAIWENADTLPRVSEIETPGQWVRRVLG